MNCIEATEPCPVEGRSECVVNLPFGLLGFEQFKTFALVTRLEEAPFLRLYAVEAPDLAFLVVSPFVVFPAYRPEIPDMDAQFLELERPEDALIFNLVTLRGPSRATINLKGPIVLNRHTLLAKQVIPLNAPEYSVAHPLPIQTD